MDKKIFKSIFVAALIIAFTSCELNDVVDNVAIVGQRAPNVYWEVPNAVVNAGDSVEFTVQYWDKEDDVNYLGVWYDINSSMTFSLAYTGLYNVSYTYSKDSIANVRDFQEIINFTPKHNKKNWVDSVGAYKFTAKFPVSYTLISTEIKEPSSADVTASTLEKFIPEYMQRTFKKNLSPLLLADAVNVDVNSQEKFLNGLKSRNLFNLLVVSNQLTDTASYISHFEIFFNENSGRNEPRIIPASTINHTDTLNSLILKLPVQKLIYNNTKVAYQLQYINRYKLNSRFRTANTNGADNYSFVKEITVN